VLGAASLWPEYCIIQLSLRFFLEEKEPN
jgi:hypothetical protein